MSSGTLPCVCVYVCSQCSFQCSQFPLLFLSGIIFLHLSHTIFGSALFLCRPFGFVRNFDGLLSELCTTMILGKLCSWRLHLKSLPKNITQPKRLLKRISCKFVHKTVKTQTFRQNIIFRAENFRKLERGIQSEIIWWEKKLPKKLTANIVRSFNRSVETVYGVQ